MKSFFLFCVFCACSWAIDTTERCGVSAGIPEGACYIQGYLKDIAYDGLMEPSANQAATLTFHLMDEQGHLLSTVFKPGTSLRVRYYIESSKGSDALGMVTFTSLAMSAFNNQTPVNVIYKNDTENSTVFLVGFQLLRND